MSAVSPMAAVSVVEADRRSGRVEDGRGSLGHAVTLRFPSPLIEPAIGSCIAWMIPTRSFASSVSMTNADTTVCGSRRISARQPVPTTLYSRTNGAYFARWKVTTLRVIPLSAQFGMTRQGVNTCSWSSSILNDRVCSVPTHSGFHATSTLVTQLSPSIR